MTQKSITIAHLFPELLNLYGDSGNIITLTRRLEWRGLQANVQEVALHDTPNFSQMDIVFIGGGSDREQRIVAEHLQRYKHELKAYVEAGGVLLAVCGGYQLLGHYYQLGDEQVAGLSLVDMYTTRGEPRLIGNIVVQTDLCEMPIVGYENHGGRTQLEKGVTPLGHVLYGNGNDGASREEGVRYKNVVGTYIHGPLLPKNPQVADWILKQALANKYGEAASLLAPLDDTAEKRAHQAMYKRLLSGKVKE